MATNTPFVQTSVGTRNLANDANSIFHHCQAPEILENFVCESFVQMVSEGRRLQETLDQNKIDYRFMKTSMPTVHGGHATNANYASPEMRKVTECVIRLGHQAYINEKIDTEQMKYMVKSYASALSQDSNKKFGQALSQKHMNDFMCWLGTQVHPCNEGSAAGKTSGGINLGTISNPILVNPRNSLSVLTLLDQALSEHNLPSGNRVAIISPMMKTQMRLSVGGAIANTGRGMGEYMGSQCADLGAYAPCGQDIYEYTCSVGVPNPTVNGQMVFPIYYIWKPALDTAYGMDKENSGIKTSNDINAAVYNVQRMIIKYGFSTVYCQGIARAWVALDPNWQDKLPGGSCA